MYSAGRQKRFAMWLDEPVEGRCVSWRWLPWQPSRFPAFTLLPKVSKEEIPLMSTYVSHNAILLNAKSLSRLVSSVLVAPSFPSSLNLPYPRIQPFKNDQRVPKNT